MTGNVSTDESRKEIRNSPGAPSVPANATTLCFHPLNKEGKTLHLVLACHSERSEESLFAPRPSL